MTEDDDEDRALEPSRSRLKRDRLALQGLAERLVALPRAQLEALDFGEATWAAIDETARIKDQRALRRHYKRIAKLLAREDLDAAEGILQRKEEQERAAAARHHQVERWRERLIVEGDDAMAELLALCPGADRPQLRALVRAAQRDTERGRPEAPRKLFRFLRETLEREGR